MKHNKTKKQKIVFVTINDQVSTLPFFTSHTLIIASNRKRRKNWIVLSKSILSVKPGRIYLEEILANSVEEKLRTILNKNCSPELAVLPVLFVSSVVLRSN